MGVWEYYKKVTYDNHNGLVHVWEKENVIIFIP